MSDVFFLELAYGGKLLAPFQFGVDIARFFNPAIEQQIINTILTPLIENHTGELYEYWIDYDAVGNVAKIKAVKLFEIIRKFIPKNSKLTITMDVPRNEMTADNEELINFFELFHAEQFNFQFNADKSLISSSLKLDENLALLFPRLNDILSSKKENSPFNTEYRFEQEHLQLMQYAWTLTHFDALDMARNIFQLGYDNVEDSHIKCLYLNSLQSIRIGLQQYEAAMNQTLPLIIDDPAIRGFLCYSKAYSSVLMRNTKLATTYFNILGIDENLPLTSIENLYKLNIYALYLFQKGNVSTANEIEHKMNDSIVNFTDKNTIFISYINSLNLFRLHRFEKNLPKAKAFSDEAYNHINGFKTASDQLYHNLTNGLIYEGLNDYENAFYCLLRAALFWEAMHCPTALAWRPRATIIGKSFSFSKSVAPFEINNYFIDKLTLLINKLKLNISTKKKTLTFLNYNSIDIKISDATYVGVNELSFILTANTFESVEFPCKKTQLNSLLVNIIETLSCVDLPESSTIIVDGKIGYETPLNEAEVICRTFALNHHEYVFDGVSKEIAPFVINSMDVHLSPLVYELEKTDDNIHATFKRFHNPIKLAVDEFKLLNKLHKTGSKKMAELISQLSVDILQSLYNKNLVIFTLEASYIKSYRQVS